MFTIEEVGGVVKDTFPIYPKDMNCIAVPEKILKDTVNTDRDMFQILTEYIVREGYQIFLITPVCYTIRAKFPQHHINAGLVADFVMVRKKVEHIKSKSNFKTFLRYVVAQFNKQETIVKLPK